MALKSQVASSFRQGIALASTRMFCLAYFRQFAALLPTETSNTIYPLTKETLALRGEGVGAILAAMKKRTRET
jgi:hypothetical protein